MFFTVRAAHSETQHHAAYTGVWAGRAGSHRGRNTMHLLAMRAEQRQRGQLQHQQHCRGCKEPPPAAAAAARAHTASDDTSAGTTATRASSGARLPFWRLTECAHHCQAELLLLAPLHHGGVAPPEPQWAAASGSGSVYM